MYEIRTIDVPSEGISVFKNEKKVLEVLNVGATLNHLCLLESENIIDAYTAKEFSSFEWSKSAILFPFPNRLRDGKYSFEGHDYQFPINETSNHNALHGFVFAEKFDLIKKEATDAECVLKFGLEYDGRYEYYPFPFNLHVEYRLTDSNLDSRFIIQNSREGKLPFGFGWHPYFVLSDKVDDLQIQLPKMSEIQLDERQLPTGETRDFGKYLELQAIAEDSFDTGFKVHDPDYLVVIRNEQGLQLTFSAENQPYLQIFTPDDRRRLAVEPMSSGIDVFNSKDGLTILSAGEKVEFSTSIKAQNI